MTNPNIVDVTGIAGQSNIANVLTTTEQTIVGNPVSSGSVIKLNTVLISNINATANIDSTVIFSRGGTPYHICKTVTIPPQATLVAISKETGLYLEEGDSLTAYANVADSLSITTSYEIIS